MTFQKHCWMVISREQKAISLETNGVTEFINADSTKFHDFGSEEKAASYVKGKKGYQYCQVTVTVVTPELPQGKFTITCNVCESPAEVINDIEMGSSQTGRINGSIRLVCTNCDNILEID